MKNASPIKAIPDKVFAGIVDICADGIISIDENHRICLFNHGAIEIFGYEPQEVLGKPLQILLPESAKEVHSAHIREFQETQKPARRMGERGEIFGRRKNGEIFPAEASISKQQIEGQWIFTALVRDVTEARRAEETLERMNRELKRSNSDLEHFAAVASHDLQEPLRKIQAFGERLESRYKENLPERGQDYLSRMQNAASRMSTLIQDLLAFSRVTTRAQPFRRLDLNEVIKQVVLDLEIQIEGSHGEVIVGPLRTLDADPLQMRLLFQNLISNGLKFHRPDLPPVVQVSAEEKENFLEITVEDNGVGFDEKYLDRIFELFQRLHGRGEFEGTGIGLAIARKIVERHGGEIVARSAPQEGTTFLIRLPFTQENHQFVERALEKENEDE